MSLIKKLLLALTPREIDLFLPGKLHSAVRALAQDSLQLDPAALPAAEFRARLAEFDPDVLVSCWSIQGIFFEPAANLRYICHLCGSVRSLVTRRHLERGLLVSDWGDSISRVVAESALLLALAALRKAGDWMPAMQRDGAWRDDRLATASLFGRTVGIHGFGRVARELIGLLRPFGVAIGVHAPECDPAPYTFHRVVRVGTLDELFSGHSVIFELAPLIPATTGIVTERHLRRIPAGGVFVNVGRGAVVDEAGLLRVAREGAIGVALDVYAVEPLPSDSGLRGLRNVILSPHLGGPTPDRCCDAGAFGLANLRAYAEGRPVQSAMTLERFDAST